MQEKGNLSINSENFMPIIKKWLYTDKDIFIRELVSNACDAVTKLQKLSMMGEADIPAEEAYEIHVVLDQDKKTLQIIDNGIGMTKEVLKKVTEPFYMADKSRSRKAGGAGLGLSLCVEIAKRHNARITAKSRPGVGTAVYVTVPWAKIGGAVGDEK